MLNLPDVTSNGEIERPRRSVGLATWAHNLFPRPRRPTTHVSRPVPMIVRGRPHSAYCARAESSAQTETGQRNHAQDAKRRHCRDKRSHWHRPCRWPHRLPARAQTETPNEGSWPRIFEFRMPSMRILVASSNGELERPHAGASGATRAQNFAGRARRATTGVSRPAPSVG